MAQRKVEEIFEKQKPTFNYNPPRPKVMNIRSIVSTTKQTNWHIWPFHYALNLH